MCGKPFRVGAFLVVYVTATATRGVGADMQISRRGAGTTYRFSFNARETRRLALDGWYAHAHAGAIARTTYPGKGGPHAGHGVAIWQAWQRWNIACRLHDTAKRYTRHGRNPATIWLRVSVWNPRGLIGAVELADAIASKYINVAISGGCIR